MGGRDTYLRGDLGLICYPVLLTLPAMSRLNYKQGYASKESIQTSAKPKSTFKEANGKQRSKRFTSRRPLGLTGSSGAGAVGTELVSTCKKQ